MIDCLYEVTVPYKNDDKGRTLWRTMERMGKIPFILPSGSMVYPIIDDGDYSVDGSYWDFVNELLVVQVRESKCDYSECDDVFFNELRLTFEGLGFSVQNPSCHEVRRARLESVQ